MAIEHGFSLDAFMKNASDFARGYTFYAKIATSPIPNLIKDEQKFLVRTSSLPTSTITPVEANWQGMKYKLGSTQEFSELNITYNVDKTAEIRKSFVDWMNEVHDPSTGYHGNPEKYMGAVHLEHLSHTTGEIIEKYILHGAWPSAVAELSLDYSTQDTAQFDVTFTYQFHTVE